MSTLPVIGTKEDPRCASNDSNLEIKNQQDMVEFLTKEVARLKKGLGFYAGHNHYEMQEEDEWEVPSGEPANIFYSENGSSIEDGSIARLVLNGADLDNLPDDMVMY